MQNLSDLILFKTVKCQEALCESYHASNHPNQLPEKFADCYEYHNDCDRKREPFTDLASLTLSYQPIKPSYNRTPDVCLNQVEYLYHPVNFKAAQCNGCPGYFCPYYHTAQEKQKWDGLLKRILKAESPVSSSLEPNSGKFGRALDAREENMKENMENGEKRYIFQEYKMHSDDHKVKLEDKNPFFEVVDDDNYADYGENIKREVQQVAVERQGPVMSSQIQDDYKLAMELDKQLNGDMEKEEAMRNTQAFLKRNQGLGNNKQVNNVVYIKKEDQRIFEEDNTSMNNKGNEYIDSRGELSHSDRNDNEVIPSDMTREFKKVYAITEADIMRRKFTSSHVPKKPVLQSSTVPFFYGTRLYKYGGKIDIHENRQNEFKCFRTNQYYEELIEKYVPGFLNSRGGTIYLGISDDGKSWGIKLGTLMMQDLVSIFERKFKHFTPPVRPEQYCIEACPVYDKDPKVYIREQYVLQIVIAQGDPTELHFNDKDNAYIRKQASTIFLTPAAIRDELKARTKKQMARKLVSLLDENGFDECLKRQSVKDLAEIKKLFEQKMSLIDAYLKEDKQEYKELLSKLGLQGFF